MSSNRSDKPSTRDQLENAVAIVRRMLHYWWLIGALAFAGAIIAVVIGILAGRSYLSETIIMHREIIPSRVLQGPNAISDDRNMEARFRDMARSTHILLGVIERNGILADVLDDQGQEAAITEMRNRIKFRSRGGGTFHLSYQGETPRSAQDVTQDLAESLIREELDFRRRGVEATRTFLSRELEQAEGDLHDRELAVAEFLARHPEFADDASAGLASSAGASIRALKANKPARTADPVLASLRRQRSRIEARLTGRPEEPSRDAPSPEIIDARQQLDATKRDMDARERELEAVRTRFTDQHPDVVLAEERADQARRRVARAEEKLAALQRVEQAQRAPATPVDREELRAELARVDNAIAEHIRKGQVAPTPLESNTVESAVVKLESEWARLRRSVDEARERLEAIEAKAFTAEIFAASELGGQGAQLEILDPASKPTRPSGMPRRLMAIAGFLAFGSLGLALTLILALADDRLYTSADWVRFGLHEPLVIPASRRKLLPWRK